MLASKVVGIMLQYLYTGRCLFPRDNLNLGIELMAAADQFLLDPMKAQCERLLSDQIDSEVILLSYDIPHDPNSSPRLLFHCTTQRFGS